MTNQDLCREVGYDQTDLTIALEMELDQADDEEVQQQYHQIFFGEGVLLRFIDSQGH